MNRPQTRRRRENSAECLDKMRTMRENIYKALEMAELALFREKRKREMYVSNHLACTRVCCVQLPDGGGLSILKECLVAARVAAAYVLCWVLLLATNSCLMLCAAAQSAEVEMQRYQLKMHHQPRQFHESIEKEAVAKLRDLMERSQRGEGRLASYMEVQVCTRMV